MYFVYYVMHLKIPVPSNIFYKYNRINLILFLFLSVFLFSSIKNSNLHSTSYLISRYLNLRAQPLLVKSHGVVGRLLQFRACPPRLKEPVEDKSLSGSDNRQCPSVIQMGMKPSLSIPLSAIRIWQRPSKERRRISASTLNPNYFKTTGLDNWSARLSRNIDEV